MANNLYSKYVKHATVVLEHEDVDENLSVLEDIFDSKINVMYPLTIVLAGRNFKIKDRDSLNTFINAAQCMAEVCDAIAARKVQQSIQYVDVLRELDTPAKRHVFRDFPNGFGVSSTDELMPNWQY